MIRHDHSQDDLRRRRASCSARRPRGFVLLIVLVVIVALSLAAYTFSDLMITHRHAMVVSGRQIQARWLVDSGVEAVKLYLMMDPITREEMGGLYDNPLVFQGQIVLPDVDPDANGAFTVLSPYLDPSGTGAGVRYGLEDESGRLNLNALLIADQAQGGAGRTLLMALPGMTEDVADAILDWMDEDDEPREYGAELEYYSSLASPYEPKNGPLTSVEELLLVRGVTPQLLFGVDANHNGVVDPHEMNALTVGEMDPLTGISTSQATSSLLTSGGTPGMVERGWSAYLTIYSAEANVNSEGQPRINVNQEDLQALHDELIEVFDEESVNFILAYRLYGPSEQSEDDQAGNVEVITSSDVELDLSQQGATQITRLVDLIDAQITIPSTDEGGDQNQQDDSSRDQEQQEDQSESDTQRVLMSPFRSEDGTASELLPLLMDQCTAVDTPVIPARLNVNTAPRELLLGLPNMTEEIADAIVAARSAQIEGQETLYRESEIWILMEGIVTVEQMKQWAPFLCGGGDVYRCQIVGYFQGGGASSRSELVIDATGSEPSILLWRDITHLGRGYPLAILGMDMLTGAPVR